MASVNITFNIPDDQVDRINSALRAYFGPVVEFVTAPEGNDKGLTTSRDLTSEELIEKIRAMAIANIRRIVSAVEAEAAAQQTTDELNIA